MKLFAVLFVKPLGADGEEDGRNEMIVALGSVLRRQQVAGNFLANELVKGLVRVEGREDVIAVTPRVGTNKVALLARGLGVARHIEPVPAPAFAELRGREQAVHDFLQCGNRNTECGIAGCPRGTTFLHERLHIGGRRGEADEIEGETAQ